MVASCNPAFSLAPRSFARISRSLTFMNLVRDYPLYHFHRTLTCIFMIVVVIHSKRPVSSGREGFERLQVLY